MGRREGEKKGERKGGREGEMEGGWEGEMERIGRKRCTMLSTRASCLWQQSTVKNPLLSYNYTNKTYDSYSLCGSVSTNRMTKFKSWSE